MSTITQLINMTKETGESLCSLLRIFSQLEAKGYSEDEILDMMKDAYKGDNDEFLGHNKK